ncbi:MFS transporter [Streptomonospora wellingtoniae]|uniref:MFS transporter n=1 Tax=Streptomonospora wellingtoniae TaxID=3075544 RepID=A0ABU2KMZ8_9ACTN|nr:MFS transporter [Streptomonospora sp. DSM 45055]MDT0300644.1 MFS transporter [Streptomonospora sp. DSM 45055]
MTRASATAPDAFTAADVAPRARRALIALCVTVTTSYGVLFYAFPVLAPAISADTGWPLAHLTAAFSAAQVVAGLGGAVVGRWLERSGPRTVMTCGAVAAVPAVAGIAWAPALWVFFAAWLAAGAAMAGLFYPPAFAALTRWYGQRRTGALTVLTLAAGLASTVFAPLAAALEQALGWRGAYLALAGLFAVVVIPLHALALVAPWRRVAAASRARTQANAVGPVIASRAFLALTGALTLGAFGVYAVVVNLVPLLDARGFDPSTAAWALGIGGIGQVLGRLVYVPLEHRAGPLGRAVLVLAACAATTALLAVVSSPAALVMAVALTAGVARGILTLLEATAVSDRWGIERYATLNGVLHTPLMLAVALAPWAGAAMAGPLGGYPAVFAVLAALGAVAAVLAVFTRPERSG